MNNHPERPPIRASRFFLLIVVVTALSALGVARPRAQVPAHAGDRPVFDAASVKPNKSGGPGSRENLSQPGGYVTATNATLQYLIEKSYFPYHRDGAPNTRFLIYGVLPGWVNSEHFDVEAKAEGSPTVSQKQLMLRSLLEDRFKLILHHETRQLPVSALVLVKAGKTGPQLLPDDGTKCFNQAGPTPQVSSGAAPMPPCGVFFVRLHGGSLFPEAHGITMEWLAANLSGMMGRLVVDRTGLIGTFDVTLGYTPELGQPSSQLSAGADASDPSAPPSIFTALQEQLGLKLESQTGPVEVLVIDHVEQPSEN